MKKLFFVIACALVLSACCNKTNEETVCTNDTIACDTVASVQDTAAKADTVACMAKDTLVKE